MANDGSGGAPTAAPAAPAQGGQAGQGGQQGYAPQQQRARVGEFGAFSAGIQPQLSQKPVFGADGQQGQPINVQNVEVLDRGYDAPDPFDALYGGEDAKSLTLAVPDDPLALDENGQPMQQSAEGQVHQAHVVTEAEVRAWLDEYHGWRNADDLAEPLMDKFVVAQVDGQRYRIPVREAIKGYQLHSDYSNKLREVYAFRDQLLQQEAGLQKLLRDMEQGQTFLDAMVFLNKFKGFSEAAIIYGTQLDAERRMTPEQREVHKALRAQRAALQRLEIENRNLRAQSAPRQEQPQQNGPTNEQMQQIYMQQLAHIAPRVADKLGFVPTPYAKDEFERHFQQMLPSIVGQDLTSEFVETVMRATMESVDAQLARSGFAPQQAQQPAAAPQGQPRVPAGSPQGGQWAGQQRQRQLPPVSQVPGPSQPAQQRAQRMRIGDFGRAIQGKPV